MSDPFGAVELFFFTNADDIKSHVIMSTHIYKTELITIKGKDTDTDQSA